MLLRTTTHFQIDVARHFRSKAEIIKLLDEMARIKLQPLHLSLTNDEGWRLEISALPELTEVGGRRCHDLSERTALLPQLVARDLRVHELTSSQVHELTS